MLFDAGFDSICTEVGFIVYSHGRSAVERRTRNRESPGSNPPLLLFQSWGIFVLSMMPQFTQLYYEYLAIGSCENGANRRA